MNLNRITRYLPWLILGCGGIGGSLRALMMRLCIDEKGLLKPWNLPQILLILLTLAVLALVILTTRTQAGSNRYGDNFRRSLPAGISSFAAAGAIALLVLRNFGTQKDMLSSICLVAAALSIPCLILAGLARIRGKRPHFLTYAALCLFFGLHMADQYRQWSSLPLMADYVFQLFACVFLSLSAYSHTAFCTGMGRRLRHLVCGTLAAYFSLVSMFVSGYGLFYLVCGVWALLNLCHPEPRPRRAKPVEAPAPEAQS